MEPLGRPLLRFGAKPPSAGGPDEGLAPSLSWLCPSVTKCTVNYASWKNNSASWGPQHIKIGRRAGKQTFTDRQIAPTVQAYKHVMNLSAQVADYSQADMHAWQLYMQPATCTCLTSCHRLNGQQLEGAGQA